MHKLKSILKEIFRNIFLCDQTRKQSNYFFKNINNTNQLLLILLISNYNKWINSTKIRKYCSYKIIKYLIIISITFFDYVYDN